MCTLIIGNQVLGPETVVIAANRDEDPTRPSDPPGVLRASPRLTGGRDRRAGGTWLVVRERRAMVAMLNRRDPRPDAAREPRPGAVSGPLRSRGLLALEVAAAAAAAQEPLSRAAFRQALALLERDRYAPFSLAYLAPDSAWILTGGWDGPPRSSPVPTGWHVLTHAALDDPDEPRAAWLLAELSGWSPAGLAEAEHGLLRLLASHGELPANDSPGHPTVCVHDGIMPTVSASLVSLSADQARYLHVEGRPCESAPADRSDLLAGELVTEVRR